MLRACGRACVCLQLHECVRVRVRGSLHSMNAIATLLN